MASIDMAEWRTAVVIIASAFIVVALILAGDKSRSNADAKNRVGPILRLIVGLVAGIGIIGLMQWLGYEFTGMSFDFFMGEK